MALGSYFFTKIGCNGLVSFHLLGCFISCIAVLQLTNGAVDPTTWRNRNVQVVGRIVVWIFSSLLLKSFHFIACLDAFPHMFIFVFLLYDGILLCLISICTFLLLKKHSLFCTWYFLMLHSFALSYDSCVISS